MNVEFANTIFVTSVLVLQLMTITIPGIESLAITTIETGCETDRFSVRVRFDGRFGGVIYAKRFGDDRECRVRGGGSSAIELQFPLKYCGLRSSSPHAGHNRTYSVRIVVQFDRVLQQVHDIERLVSCTIPNDSRLSNRRAGRKLLETTHDRMLTNGRVWMEFTSDATKRNIEVGDLVKMTINAVLPGGYDWRVASCEASDGTRNVSQPLTDLRGCPVDATIMPQLTKINVNNLEGAGNNDDDDDDDATKEPKLRHRQAFVEFIAFKFPDRDTLNIVCQLEICNRNCSDISCTETTGTRLPKSATAALDSIEIFNSIDVSAPRIEIEQFSAKKSSHQFESDEHSEQICISSVKLAIAFSLLGVLFVSALVVSIWCLIRSFSTSSLLQPPPSSLLSSSSSPCSKNSSTTYTRSSGSNCPSDEYGPNHRFMNQFLTSSSPRSSSRWSYGRIF